MPTPRQQRLKDYVDSPIMGVSVSQDYLESAKACLVAAYSEKSKSQNFGKGNHFTMWAIPTCILFVNSLEIFLHEVISFLNSEGIISDLQKEDVGKISSLVDRFTAIQNVMNQNSSHISAQQKDDLKLAVELRNDLVHYFPRTKFTDDVNVEFERRDLLVPDNVVGRKHASYQLARWVALSTIQLAVAFGDDLDTFFKTTGKADTLAAINLPVLKDNFVDIGNYIQKDL